MRAWRLFLVTALTLMTMLVMAGVAQASPDPYAIIPQPLRLVLQPLLVGIFNFFALVLSVS